MKLYRTFNDSSIVWALFKIQLTPKEIIRFWRMEQNQFKMNQFGSKFTETSTTSKLDSRKKLGWGGGQLKKSQKKSKSISGILGWVLTFFDPKF